MRTDGTAPTRLTTGAASGSGLAWSPDSSRLAFVTSRDGDAEIFTMAADGTGQSRLTNNTAHDAWVSRSPTGKLAFTSDRDGNLEIYSMDPDGSSPTRLTKVSAPDFQPAW